LSYKSYQIVHFLFGGCVLPYPPHPHPLILPLPSSPSKHLFQCVTPIYSIRRPNISNVYIPPQSNIELFPHLTHGKVLLFHLRLSLWFFWSNIITSYISSVSLKYINFSHFSFLVVCLSKITSVPAPVSS